MNQSRFLFALVLCCVLPSAARAATEAQAMSSLEAARAAEALARAAKSAWTPTETALSAAEKAFAAKDFDTAKDRADEAAALAKRSIEQAEEQKSVWRDAIIH